MLSGRIVSAAGKEARDLTILPGAQLATSLYNAGLPPAEKIECIDEVKDSRLDAWRFAQPLAWPGEIVGIGAGATGIIAVDNIHAGADTFKVLYNAGLPEASRLINEDKRHLLRKLDPLSLPGAVLGLAAGITTLTAIDSTQAAAGVFTTTYNLGLPSQDRINQGDKRGLLRKLDPLGLPGATLGLAAGLTTLATIDNAYAGHHVFTGIYNFGLLETQRLKTQDNRQPIRKFNPLGIPGALVGGTLGILTVTAVDNGYAAAATFAEVFNIGLPQADYIDTSDERSAIRIFNPLGLPGALIGATGGLATVTFIDNCYAAFNVFRKVYNQGLADADQIFNDYEETRATERVLNPLALPGAVAGFVTGVGVVAIVDSAYAAANTFKNLYNIGIPETDRFVRTQDSRSTLRKLNPLGLPGAILGVTAGVGTIAAQDNIHAAANTYTGIYNIGLPEGDRIICEDPRDNIRKLDPLGLPGAAGGLVAGLTSVAAMDNVKTAANVFTGIYNLGLPQVDRIEREDKRSWGRRLNILSAPGAVAGLVAGTATIAAIDSVCTAAILFAGIYNLGLPKNQRLVSDDKRHLARKLNPLGLPGVVAGLIVGTGTIAAIDSFKNGTAAFKGFYNIGLPEPERLALSEDDRSALRRFNPLSLPGAAVGLTASAGTVVAVDNVRSGLGLMATIFNTGLDDSQKITCINSADDQRHALRKYGPHAWPGLALGAVAGTSLFVAYDNVKSGAATFTSLVNFTLQDSQKITCMTEFENDKRHPLRKFGPLVWPGIAVGGVTGGLAMGVIQASRFTLDSYESWQALSGSYMNVALERHLFEGVSKDTTPGILRGAARVTGYVAASATTAPLGIVTYLFRKTPDVAGLVLGTGFSWAVAIGKGISACCGNESRFTLNVKGPQAIEQKLKDIYSSLDGWGRLRAQADSKVVPGQNGKTSGWSTLRKCFTLNADTPTEKILNEIAKEFKKHPSEDASFFDGNHITNAVNRIQEEYKSDWMLSHKTIRAACQEVVDVASFVKEYMQVEIGTAMTIQPDFYSRRQTSWSTLFSTAPPQKSQTPTLGLATDEEKPAPRNYGSFVSA